MFARVGPETTLPPVLAQASSALALVLLIASGVSKQLDPDPTTGAMQAARLPSSRLISRTLGLAEAAAGVTGLTFGGVWLSGATLLYASFFAFTAMAVRRRLPLQSCGCFGRDDTPPSALHVVFNGLSALALGYLVAVDQNPVPWSDPPVQVAVYLAFSLVGAYLAYLLLAQLPDTLQMAEKR
jgi:hypothetical protein